MDVTIKFIQQDLPNDTVWLVAIIGEDLSDGFVSTVQIESTDPAVTFSGGTLVAPFNTPTWQVTVSLNTALVFNLSGLSEQFDNADNLNVFTLDTNATIIDETELSIEILNEDGDLLSFTIEIIPLSPPGIEGCMDVDACNYDSDATVPCDDCCEYPDCAGNCPPTVVIDCNGDCGGTAVLDECGVCNGPGATFECPDGSFVCEEADCDAPSEECEDLLIQIKIKEEELSDLEGQLAALNDQYAEAESSKIKLEETITGIKDEILILEDSIDKLEQTIAKIQDDINALEQLFCSDDIECILVSVIDSNGNAVAGYDVYIDGGNAGITDINGYVLYSIPNASVNTNHTLQFCYCFTTEGNCRQQKITITVAADECATECIITPNPCEIIPIV